MLTSQINTPEYAASVGDRFARLHVIVRSGVQDNRFGERPVRMAGA